MPHIRLFSLYSFFAIIATIVNLLTQEIIFQLYTAFFQLGVSMFTGTLTGLMVKYILDKKYIFHYYTNSKSKNRHTFILYCIMGIVTTLIFWVSEFTFEVWFATKTMRYVGASIGLCIGYLLKYQLDKKFVFI